MLRVDDNNKPVLRLESREDFARIPEPLRAEICKQLGIDRWDESNFDIRIISEDEKYAKHYIRRVQALNAGAQFLLNSLKTETNENRLRALQDSLNSMSAQCCDYLEKLESTDIRHYQNSLVHFSEVLITFIAVKTGISPKKLREELDRSEQFATASITRPSVCTVSHGSDPATDKDFIVQIDTPENPFSMDIIMQLSAIKQNDADGIPEWFKELENHEKRLLKHFLSLHDEGEYGPLINTISSKLRIIPVPANYGRHTLITCTKRFDEKDFTLTTFTPEFRSSHVASRDVKKNLAEVRRTHAYNNLKKEVEDAIAVEMERRKMQHDNTDPQNEIVIPILYQTLITPFKAPDSSLNEDRIQAVTDIIYELNTRKRRANEANFSFALISTNHPLNYGKYAAPTTSWGFDTSTGSSIDNLLFVMRRQIADTSDPRHILLNTLEDHTMKLWSIEPYRELYLSSLEQLVISECGGISIGSCVSGKDRKAVEIAHTDALKIYYNRYTRLPPLTAETDNDKAHMEVFARIFAEIYCTKHQMIMADFNAPGSFGIKTPSMYLPEHLQVAIRNWYTVMGDSNPVYKTASNKDLLKESDIMASNNEIEKFKSRQLSSSQTDPSWKSTALSFRDDDTIPFIIQMTKTAAKYYIDTRSERRGFFTRLSGSEAGKCRAMLCINLLEDPAIKPFHKIVFIHTLLGSNLGEQLLTDILKKIGFDSLDTAKQVLASYISLTASHEGFSDISPIKACAGTILTELKSIATESEIQKRAENIKAAFASLQPPIKDISPYL